MEEVEATGEKLNALANELARGWKLERGLLKLESSQVDAKMGDAEWIELLGLKIEEADDKSGNEGEINHRKDLKRKWVEDMEIQQNGGL